MTSKIIFWLLLNYGLTNIMVYGSIFEGLRQTIGRWGDSSLMVVNSIFKFISGILSCPMCFSTWSGFLLGFLIFSPTHTLFDVPVEFSWFLDGVLASGGVWAINSIVEWFENK